MPPTQWERAWASLRRRDVLGRIALALLASAVACSIIAGWNPPFAYRTGFVPQRAIVSRAAFLRVDQAATDAARQRARSQVRYVYEQDARPLVVVRGELRNAITELTKAKTLGEVDPQLWREFDPLTAASSTEPPPETPASVGGGPVAAEERFQLLREQVAGQENLERVERALTAAFAPFEQRGVLAAPPEDKALGSGNPDEILVHPRGMPELLQMVKVSDVLMGDKSALKQAIHVHFESEQLADALFAWLAPRIVPTLMLDRVQTQRAMDDAAEAVENVVIPYSAGDTLVKAGEEITPEQLDLLRLEHVAAMTDRSTWQKLVRALTVTVTIFAFMVVCGIFMRYRQRGPLASFTRLLVLLLMALATIGLARAAAADQWRAEIVPLMLFGMTVSIVYRQELATLLTAAVAFVIVLGVGHGLPEFVLLFGVASVANLSLGSVRSRRKLIYVGLAAGAAAVLLEIALAVINDQPLGRALLIDAIRTGFWAVAAGFLMTGLLPFIEQAFGVLTDLSLLELGDVTHPLLQELVRRAPSTYNHSLTVGSIAEAAAESIGARGLLCRVGAYFHDIGKMLKPTYFVENQGTEGSRHEGLVPAMSTLVIIAHIKDGSDLARQHRLPQPIIDLIVQHHGTTLIEYFYDRAHERSLADPNGGEVDEKSFRYPGPKPQTKEAAVLMLADAVESASRTLVDPAPARIEGLVRSLAERRLHDGQFDESGLTLRELRTIERSLVISLTSIYHGRIKYPEQRTA
ncbi:MAG: HD family phosphohydrolase [Planctomycetota bacterium]